MTQPVPDWYRDYALPDHYCIHMHGGIQIFFDNNGQLTVQPCAKWYDRPWSLLGEDAFNHPRLLELRRFNRDHAALPVPDQQFDQGDCRRCVMVDPVAGQRHRTNQVAWNAVHCADGKPRYDLPGPVHLAIKADTTCNLACVICVPELSTKWRNELGIKNWAVRPDLEKLRKVIESLDLSVLECLHLYGGEPFLGPTTPMILETMRDVLPNIVIRFDTNGTVRPNQRTLELLSECKQLQLKLSIDGVGSAFEYLRWPGQWNQVEDNLLWFNEIFPDNTRLIMRPAIGLLNAECIRDLDSWAQQKFSHRPNGDPIEIEYNGTNGIYGMESGGEELRHSMTEIYPSQHPIWHVVPQRFENRWSRMFEILRELDQRRGKNFLDHLPHLEKYLKFEKSTQLGQ